MRWSTPIRRILQTWIRRRRMHLLGMRTTSRIGPGEHGVVELLDLGWKARSDGDPETGHNYFVSAFHLSQDTDDTKGLGNSTLALADNVFHFYPGRDGDLFEIRKQLSVEALALLRQVDDKQGVAHALRIQARASNIDEARILLNESLEICESIGDIRGTALAFNVLGCLVGLYDDRAEGTRLKRQALNVARSLNDDELTAELSLSLGLGFEGPSAEHRAILEEAASTYERLGFRMQQAQCLILCAQLACEEDDWDRKSEYLGRVLQIAREYGSESLQCTSLDLLIDVLRNQGKDAVAEELARERESLHDPFELPEDVRRSLEAAFDTGDGQIAMTAVRKVFFGAAT